MKEIHKLLAIANDLNLNTHIAELSQIKERLDHKNSELIIPLVGEFSSGKTSLINAISDSKQLETASKATTATIFEVRFGVEKCYANIHKEDGSSYTIDSIKELKNNQLQDTFLVEVYDTSKNIFSEVVLVDTPGLSSNDVRHKMVLSSYLPQSDVIFLVTDVNQQLTRSMIDFIGTAKVTNRPIYLIVSKCDTKTSAEIEEVKRYLSKEIENLPIEKIVYISAENNDLQELYDVVSEIQKNKNAIIEKITSHQIKVIADDMKNIVSDIIKTTAAPSKINDKIFKQQNELKRLENSIKSLLNETENQIQHISHKHSVQFNTQIAEKLNNVVTQKNINFDQVAFSSINTVANLILSNFKSDIGKTLLKVAREKKGTNSQISLLALENLDFSNLAFDDFNYTLNLQSLGHEYDKNISVGVKIAGAAALVAGVIFAAPAVAGAAGTVGTARTAAAVINAADTATDIGSIVAMSKTQKMMRQMKNVALLTKETQEKYHIINAWDKSAGEQFNGDGQKGILNVFISKITDSTMGKPQRKRAIQDYISQNLSPEFEYKLGTMADSIISNVSNVLYEEALSKTSEITEILQGLKKSSEEEKEAFQKKAIQLKEYYNYLLTN